MTRIIAYTYDADVHCVSCTKRRFAPKDKRHCEPAAYGFNQRVRGSFNRIERTPLDEHYVPVYAADSEGNQVHPVFSTDEHEFTHCGDCHAPL